MRKRKSKDKISAFVIDIKFQIQSGKWESRTNRTDLTGDLTARAIFTPGFHCVSLMLVNTTNVSIS